MSHPRDGTSVVRAFSRRRRVALNCINCRNRKVKCDRQRPCSQCKSRKMEATCETESTSNAIRGEIRDMRDIGLEGNDHFVNEDERNPLSPPNDALIDTTASVDAVSSTYEYNTIYQGRNKGSDTIALLESLVTTAKQAEGQPADPISNWTDWLVFRHEGEHQHMDSTISALRKNLPQSQFLLLAAQDLPDEATSWTLIDIYCVRIRFLVGHIVHIPTMRRQVRAFYANGRICDDPTWLALFFALCLAVVSHPPRQWDGLELWTRTEVAQRWYEDAVACLELSQSSSLSPVLRDRNAIRAARLLDFYEPDQLKAFARLRIEITSAQILGLQSDGTASTTLLDKEMDRRLWWALCARDWTGAIGYGTHMIHGEHTKTLKPGNYNDDDLETGLGPRPKTEMTEMSFVLMNIELADVIRQDAHLRHKNGLSINADILFLDAKYRSVLDEMPIFFQNAAIKANEDGIGKPALVQSWLIRLGVFQRLLGLHRKTLDKRPQSREYCVDLATNILILQRLIRPHCTILDVMWPNLVLSFSAGIVVGLDLIQSSQEHLLQERNYIRALVEEAMQTLQYISAVHKDVGSRMEKILCILLKEEDYIWSNKSKLSSDPDGTQLKARIISQVQKETAAPNISSHLNQISPHTSATPTTWNLSGSPFSHPIGVNGVHVSGTSSLLPTPTPTEIFAGSRNLSSSNDPLSQTPNFDNHSEASELYAWLLSQGLEIPGLQIPGFDVSTQGSSEEGPFLQNLHWPS